MRALSRMASMVGRSYRPRSGRRRTFIRSLGGGDAADLLAWTLMGCRVARDSEEPWPVAATARARPCWRSGLDVLVVAEEVAGIPSTLQVEQPSIGRTRVGRADAILALAMQEVDIGARRVS